jgi:hypothetical protein
MITCLTIEIANGETITHGAKTYESLPRIGEYIALDRDGIGFLFEVVAIAHSPDYAERMQTNGADLYIKCLGKEIDVLTRLSHKAEQEPN